MSSDRFSVDDPVRDNRINRAYFMASLSELDKVARQNAQPTTFPLKSIWKNEEASGQDLYLRIVLEQFLGEGQIYRDEDDRFGLTDEGRRTYRPG